MTERRIPSNTNGVGRRVGIVLSRFNPGIGDLLLAGALRAIKEAGVAEVQLEFGIPIGNGILTTNTDEQALVRCEAKGFEAAQAALELANLLEAIDGE